jgi:hypothetical protein
MPERIFAAFRQKIALDRRARIFYHVRPKECISRRCFYERNQTEQTGKTLDHRHRGIGSHDYVVGRISEPQSSAGHRTGRERT